MTPRLAIAHPHGLIYRVARRTDAWAWPDWTYAHDDGCPGCAKRRTGRLPGEIATSAFGPRLQAAVVSLSVRNRVSRRDVVELCDQLFSSRISTGTIDAILARAGDALTEPCEDCLSGPAARAVNMDETGWRLRGQQRAPWGRLATATRS